MLAVGHRGLVGLIRDLEVVKSGAGGVTGHLLVLHHGGDPAEDFGGRELLGILYRCVSSSSGMGNDMTARDIEWGDAGISSGIAAKLRGGRRRVRRKGRGRRRGRNFGMRKKIPKKRNPTSSNLNRELCFPLSALQLASQFSETSYIWKSRQAR